MTMGTVTCTNILELLLNAVTWDGIAENDTTSPLTDLYLAMYTSSPGAGGSANTNETTYTSYARVAVARDGTEWTVAAGVGTLNNLQSFPAPSGGLETVTHAAIVTTSSGAGDIIALGALSSSIALTVGVPPELDDTTTFTLT